MAAAYMLLAESDLDEATKSAALAGMRNGSFGQAQEPGAVDALAQQILSGQAGQAELATALLAGRISAKGHAQLSQLFGEADSELGPILRAWAHKAQGDAFELGISIIRQKYAAGGLAAAAPWLASGEAAQVAAFSPTAAQMTRQLAALMRQDANKDYPLSESVLVADASGKTMLPAQKVESRELAFGELALGGATVIFQRPAEQIAIGTDIRPNLDNSNMQSAQVRAEVLDVMRGNTMGGFHNLESASAVKRLKNMERMTYFFNHAPTWRDQFNFYYKTVSEYNSLKAWLNYARREVIGLQKRQAAGKKLSPEELAKIEPVSQEQWNEDYADYRPNVKHHAKMTSHLAKMEAKINDYVAITAEMEAYLKKADPGLFAELLRQAGKKMGDPLGSMRDGKKFPKRLNPPKDWGKLSRP